MTKWWFKNIFLGAWKFNKPCSAEQM